MLLLFLLLCAIIRLNISVIFCIFKLFGSIRRREEEVALFAALLVIIIINPFFFHLAIERTDTLAKSISR